eukprot:3900225-Pleurochrysis_carterae.AAC.3
MGLPNVPSIHRRELEQANEIVRCTANLLRTAHAAGAEYILEHPADRGALASPIFLNARHASLWVVPDVVALKFDTSASLITFPQCALGAASQKYTTLLVSAGLSPSLQSLQTSALPAFDARGSSGRIEDGRRMDVASALSLSPESEFPTVDEPSEARQLPATETAIPPMPAAATTPSDTPVNQSAPTTDSTEQQSDNPHRTFKRTLGPYPLRSRGAAPLALRARCDKPKWGRNTGCAFAA